MEDDEVDIPPCDKCGCRYTDAGAAKDYAALRAKLVKACAELAEWQSTLGESMSDAVDDVRREFGVPIRWNEKKQQVEQVDETLTE